MRSQPGDRGTQEKQTSQGVETVEIVYVHQTLTRRPHASGMRSTSVKHFTVLFLGKMPSTAFSTCCVRRSTHQTSVTETKIGLTR